MQKAEAHGLELGARVGGRPYELVFFFLAAAERLIYLFKSICDLTVVGEVLIVDYC